MILECPRIPQSEVWIRSYGILSGALPSSVNVVVRDSTARGVMLGSPEAWEGHNLVNTYSNGASE